MPWMYLLGSLAGIGLIVILNLMLFGRSRQVLHSLEAARARLASEVPGLCVRESILSADGRAALIRDDHAVYLVAAQGDGFIVRKCAKGTLRSLARDTARLNLRFADFTLPHFDVSLADAACAAHWQDALRNVTA